MKNKITEPAIAVDTVLCAVPSINYINGNSLEILKSFSVGKKIKI